MRIFLIPVMLVSCLMAGCGADVAGAAATIGKLQAVQAEQAKAQQDQIKKDLSAALQAGEAATSGAAGQ